MIGDILQPTHLLLILVVNPEVAAPVSAAADHRV
jgi:hypothetical protein